MLRRFVLVLGALLLAGIGLGLPAQAQYTPPGGITIDPPVVNPGETVTVSGDGCAAGVEVTISLGGSQVATVTTGEDGSFSASFEVPVGTTPGTYTVTAADCTVDVLSSTLTVQGATTATNAAAAGTTLPRTGSGTTETLLRVGIVLVACGGLLAFAARRRTAGAKG
jgi:hypothetical protein